MVFVVTLSVGRFPIRLPNSGAVRVTLWWVFRRHFVRPFLGEYVFCFMFTVVVPAANAKRHHKQELEPEVREPSRCLYSPSCGKLSFAIGLLTHEGIKLV